MVLPILRPKDSSYLPKEEERKGKGEVSCRVQGFCKVQASISSNVVIFRNEQEIKIFFSFLAQINVEQIHLQETCLARNVRDGLQAGGK